MPILPFKGMNIQNFNFSRVTPLLTLSFSGGDKFDHTFLFCIFFLVFSTFFWRLFGEFNFFRSKKKIPPKNPIIERVSATRYQNQAISILAIPERIFGPSDLKFWLWPHFWQISKIYNVILKILIFDPFLNGVSCRACRADDKLRSTNRPWIEKNKSHHKTYT